MKHVRPTLAIVATFLCLFVSASSQTLRFRVVTDLPDEGASAAARRVSLSEIDANITNLIITPKSTGKVVFKIVPASRTVDLPSLAADKEETYTVAGFAGETDIGQRIISIHKDGRIAAGALKESIGDPKPGAKKLISVTDIGEVVKDSYELEIKPVLTDWSEDQKSKARRFRVRNTVGDMVREKTYDIQLKNGALPEKQTVSVELFKGKNKLIITVLESKEKSANNMPGLETQTEIECDDPCEGISRGMNTRLIAGFEQVGASSAVGKTQPFVDLFVNVPLRIKDGNRWPARFSIWSDFRLTSTAIQKFANLSAIASNQIGLGGDGGINDVVQSFKITGGVDIRLIGESNTINSFFLPGRSSLSLILGGGVTSPITGGGRTATEIYKIPYLNGAVNPDFRALFLRQGIELAGKSNIAFAIPERDRFVRRYFAGGRLKHYFYKDNQRLELSPANLDFTIGQDEAVTRNFHRPVLTIEGFTPIPFQTVDYIYVYGGISTKLTRRATSQAPAFFLDAGPQSELSDPTKTIVLSSEQNGLTLSGRDTYFFGIGIDLFRLFKNKPAAK